MGFVTKSWPLGMFNENSQLEAVLSALPMSYCITRIVCFLSVQFAVSMLMGMLAAISCIVGFHLCVCH